MQSPADTRIYYHNSTQKVSFTLEKHYIKFWKQNHVAAFSSLSISPTYLTHGMMQNISVFKFSVWTALCHHHSNWSSYEIICNITYWLAVFLPHHLSGLLIMVVKFKWKLMQCCCLLGASLLNIYSYHMHLISSTYFSPYWYFVRPQIKSATKPKHIIAFK